MFFFAKKYGLKNLGFLTLTFRDHVVCPKEAQRRLNSLLSNVIKPRYTDYIGVMERQKSGRIHYHLLVHVGFDIRSGFDFDAVSNQDYTTASAALRGEWSFWRKTAPKFRFGRTELMPIKSTEEAIGKYIGKYIGKHMENREEADKGARLVRYSRGARMASTRFQFVSDGSAQWRAKVGAFVHYVAYITGCEPTFDGLREICGPRWAYYHREFIMALPPSFGIEEASGSEQAPPRPRPLPLDPLPDTGVTLSPVHQIDESSPLIEDHTPPLISSHISARKPLGIVTKTPSPDAKPSAATASRCSLLADPPIGSGFAETSRRLRLPDKPS